MTAAELYPFAGSEHVYQLQELVALVPRKASPAAALQPAWPGVCRLPESEQPQEPHQRAIDDVSNSRAALRSPQQSVHIYDTF